MKVVSVVGARPQFIKAAAVSETLRRSACEVLVHTGQHYDYEMSELFFEELGLPQPDHHLEVGSGSHAHQTARIMELIEPVLEQEAPDWVLVFGDTNSTLAGALAAAKMNKRVAHVEAGLRSFDRSMPEEVNRVVTDHVSSLCFAPSAAAVHNLATEGLADLTVEVGDVMVDLILGMTERISDSSAELREYGLQPRDYVLATLHRASNTSSKERLEQAVDLLVGLETEVLFPVHPRTREALREHNLEKKLTACGKVRLLPPVGYVRLMRLLRTARALLTDSGGLQKEAYFLQVPCLTMRAETEWVETVEAGWNTIVDMDLPAAKRALAAAAPASHPPLYGDGHAASRIVEELERR